MKDLMKNLMNNLLRGIFFKRLKLPCWLKPLTASAVLISIACLAWILIHRPAAIPGDIYPYLTSIPVEKILLSYQESAGRGPDAWPSVLAIYSTLKADEAQSLLSRLESSGTFPELIAGLPDSTRQKLSRRREILRSYPYYEPGRYTFPCPAGVWFEDSFGADREGGKRRHQGTDLFGAEGTPIYSVCAGVVEELGWNRLGGERVGVRGTDGNYYYYAHLQTIAPELRKGMKITQGQVLGSMGHTGDALATPDHLHFGIQLPNREWINPYPFLKAWSLQSGSSP